MSSPWRSSIDSPSRQFIREISLQTADQDRELQARLDSIADERERLHRLALEAAASEHERVIQSAARAQERLQLQIESERQRLENEEKAALEHERKQQVEQEIADAERELHEARRLDERRRAIAEARAQAAANAAAEEEKERIRQAQEAAATAERLAAEKRRLEEDEQRKHREEEAAAEERRQAAQRQADEARLSNTTSSTNPPTAATTTAPHELIAAATGIQTTMAEREAAHEQYLALHKRLKTMRQEVTAQVKTIPALKTRMGDLRREILKSIGQLTEGKGANAKPLNTIRTALREAATTQHPMMDVRPFIVSQRIPDGVDAAAAQVPGVLLFLLNWFAKYIVSQLIDEAGVAPKAADAIGIVAISIFAANEFRWRGISMLDMLLAKYHVVCPVLFGLNGSDKTENGRRRLGWERDKDSGAWATEQRHGERMTGLGAGFAALSLRNFAKATSENPLPPSHFWEALARIINTPPEQTTQTHFLLLKAMLELNAPKVISFFGTAGLAALHKAVIEFPRNSPKSFASSAVSTLPATFKRDLHLDLAAASMAAR